MFSKIIPLLVFFFVFLFRPSIENFVYVVGFHFSSFVPLLSLQVDECTLLAHCLDPAHHPRLSAFSHLIREAFPKRRQDQGADLTVWVTVAMLDDCKCGLKKPPRCADRPSETPGETLEIIGKKRKK